MLVRVLIKQRESEVTHPHPWRGGHIGGHGAHFTYNMVTNCNQVNLAPPSPLNAPFSVKLTGHLTGDFHRIANHIRQKISGLGTSPSPGMWAFWFPALPVRVAVSEGPS